MENLALLRMNGSKSFSDHKPSKIK